MTAAARTPVRAGTWRVSDSRTQVRFTVRNLGIPVRGSIAVRCGQVQVDATGAPLRVRAEFDLDSLDTGITRRDADLRWPLPRRSAAPMRPARKGSRRPPTCRRPPG